MAENQPALAAGVAKPAVLNGTAAQVGRWRPGWQRSTWPAVDPGLRPAGTPAGISVMSSVQVPSALRSRKVVLSRTPRARSCPELKHGRGRPGTTTTASRHRHRRRNRGDQIEHVQTANRALSPLRPVHRAWWRRFPGPLHQDVLKPHAHRLLTAGYRQGLQSRPWDTTAGDKAGSTIRPRGKRTEPTAVSRQEGVGGKPLTAALSAEVEVRTSGEARDTPPRLRFLDEDGLAATKQAGMQRSRSKSSLEKSHRAHRFLNPVETRIRTLNNRS